MDERILQGRFFIVFDPQNIIFQHFSTLFYCFLKFLVGILTIFGS